MKKTISEYKDAKFFLLSNFGEFERQIDRLPEERQMVAKKKLGKLIDLMWKTVYAVYVVQEKLYDGK